MRSPEEFPIAIFGQKLRVKKSFRPMVVGGSATKTVAFFLRTCALHTQDMKKVLTIANTTRLVFGLRIRTSLVATRNITVPNVP